MTTLPNHRQEPASAAPGVPVGLGRVPGWSRRTLLGAALAIGVAPALGLLAGCGAPAPEQARSQLNRLSATEPGESPRTSASFAARLAAAVRTDGTNLVCSPWSVLVALAMTRNGAEGTTAAEMDTVLGIQDLNGANQQLNTLQQVLATRNRTFPDKREVKLESANSLWGQRNLQFGGPFLDALAQYYGAGMNLVDFVAKAPEAVRMINAWTKERTHGLIEQIVTDKTVKPYTRLVLVNALYLKAPWQKPFSADLTADGAFTPTGGTPVRVPMMKGRTLLWHADDTCEATRIDYLGGELAMTVARPLRDVATTLAAWAGGGLPSVLGDWRPAIVDLTLPKWQHQWHAELNDPLAGLGMPTAFSDAAQFGRMTSTEALRIAHVLHEARITVDEQGTEAAGATAVVMEPISAPVAPERHELTLDRPFLYVIHDVPTGTPLFLGGVENPRA